MKLKKLMTLLLAAAFLFSAGACAENGAKSVELDPANPVTITVWHYYNGAIMNAFNSMVSEFNDTVGKERGVIIEGVGISSVSELESEVLKAAHGAAGSMQMPSIFASYADTAYEAEKLGLLANLDDYISKKEQAEYLDSYIEEGRIGLGGELRIFPIAKATEALMVNETDWLPFAKAFDLTYDDLSTLEGVARVSELYYQWTEARTGEGKAFFGRDSMANLFIAGSKQFGIELFTVTGGSAVLNLDRDVMRRIWDTYYIPYISGAYFSYGRFRSDDARVGDILAYVGSTTSAAFFPNEVTSGGESHAIEAAVLPVPIFEGAERVMVQQGAGMVVVKHDDIHEYASTVFLKWFTDTRNNIEFCALSGYMPVKKEAINFDVFMSVLDEIGYAIDDLTRETIRVSFEGIKESELYTNKAFNGAKDARDTLEKSLQEKASADREEILRLIEGGAVLSEVIPAFDTNENFEDWLADLTERLNAAAA